MTSDVDGTLAQVEVVGWKQCRVLVDECDVLCGSNYLKINNPTPTE
jgi:hypothetical protein